MSQVQHLAIQVKNISKQYQKHSIVESVFFKNKKRTLALDDVSFDVPKGRVFGFLGPNGAGKTSLIKIIVGIMSADKGSCYIIDKNGVGYDSITRNAKLKLGYLPERPYFHDFLTSQEFLQFHGSLVGMSKQEIRDRIPKLLKEVGLEKATNQKLKTFSKGMLQRIGFAQALIHDPEVLVLDEPMSGLDPVGRREVRDMISEVASKGKTVFFSTHILHDVEAVCDTVAFIHHGKLKGLGSIESLLGKTVRSMEVRYTLPDVKSPAQISKLINSKKAIDGWMLSIETDVNTLEAEVSDVIACILSEKGQIKSVVPRKSTLEDLFFGDSL